MSEVVAKQLRFLRFLPLLFVVACGGGDGPTSPAGPSGPDAPDDEPDVPQEAAAPTLSASQLGAMEPLVLQGLPAGRDDLVAEVAEPGASSPEAEGDFILPLLPLEGGDYRLWIPVHPTTIVEGGPVEIRIWGEDDFVTAPTELTLDPIPEAPGAFAELADTLQALLDLRFEALDMTRTEALAADWETELDPSVFPVAIAQTLLDDPNHDRDLRDLLDGAASFETLLGTSDPDLDLLDRMTGVGGLVSLVSAQLAAERGVVPAAPGARSPEVAPGAAAAGPAGVVSISSAAELDAAMERAWAAAREGDPETATGELLQGYGLTLGAIGLVTGPGGAAVTAALGSVLWAYQTYLEGTSKLLPKEFVPGSLLFDLDIAAFEEDQPGPGNWSNVRVSAQSEGWELDKTVADLLLQVAGNADAYLGWFNRVGAEASSLIRDIGTFVTGTQLGNLPIAESGLVEIDPEVWADIDITDEPWSEGRLGPSDAIELTGATQYEPRRAGEALLTVETNPARFGEATPTFQRQTVRVDPIEITILADATSVQPSQLVELQILVENALDTSLEPSLSAGTWASGPTDLGGGTWSAQVQMPGDPSQFPVEIAFESTATGGARDTPGAPVRRDVLVLSSVAVIVEPSSVFLEPGESQDFSATVLGSDNNDVTWSATGPGGGTVPIGSEGAFTAPDEQGDYLITATSVVDPSAEGFANVTVVGQCYWSLSMGGTRGGMWSGEFAAHSYPDGPIAGAFSMTFAPDEGTAPGGSGTVTAPGPSSAGTGSWEAVFGFSAGDNSWVAAVDDEDTEATLVVTENDGNAVTGSVSGTALIPLGDGEVELAPFSLTFRSNDIFGAEACGES